MSLEIGLTATARYNRRMSEFPLRELRNNTSALIRRAQAGDDVVITVSGKPAARLVAIGTREGRGVTGAQLAATLGQLEPDPTWRDDLRALRRDVGTVGSWDDDEH